MKSDLVVQNLKLIRAERDEQASRPKAVTQNIRRTWWMAKNQVQYSPESAGEFQDVRHSKTWPNSDAPWNGVKGKSPKLRCPALTCPSHTWRVTAMTGMVPLVRGQAQVKLCLDAVCQTKTATLQSKLRILKEAKSPNEQDRELALQDHNEQVFARTDNYLEPGGPKLMLRIPSTQAIWPARNCPYFQGRIQIMLSQVRRSSALMLRKPCSYNLAQRERVLAKPKPGAKVPSPCERSQVPTAMDPRMKRQKLMARFRFAGMNVETVGNPR